MHEELVKKEKKRKEKAVETIVTDLNCNITEMKKLCSNLERQVAVFK